MTLRPHILFLEDLEEGIHCPGNHKQAVLSCPVLWPLPKSLGLRIPGGLNVTFLVVAGLPVGHSHMQVCRAGGGVTQVHKESWQKATCIHPPPPKAAEEDLQLGTSA